MRASLLAVCLIGVLLQQVASHHRPEHSSGGEELQQKPRFLLGATTLTRTRTRLTTATVESYHSCVTDLGAGPCTRRRRRSSLKQLAASTEAREDDSLVSSQRQDSDVADDPNARLFNPALTIYTTVFTTATVTSTSINSSVSVQISYACTAPGMDLPHAC